MIVVVIDASYQIVNGPKWLHRIVHVNKAEQHCRLVTEGWHSGVRIAL